MPPPRRGALQVRHRSGIRLGRGCIFPATAPVHCVPGHPPGRTRRKNSRHERTSQNAPRLQSLRHAARRSRVGPQGNRYRRARDAGPDVDPQEARRRQAAQGRARHRFAAHDHPDGGADRNPQGHRRRRALGLLQHLLDPEPRRPGNRRHRHPGVRVEGRDAGRILGLHPRRSDLPGRQRPGAGRRRRRRRDPADPQGL